MSYSYGPSTSNTADPLARFRCSIDSAKLNLLSPSERDAVKQYDVMIAQWRAELSTIEHSISTSAEGPVKFALLRRKNELCDMIGALFAYVRPFQH